MIPELERTWLNVLGKELETPYMKSLREFLKTQEAAGVTIYPKTADIFNAFEFTPFEEVKVVILGQDPYHGAKQANGLSFSVQKGVPLPSSLKNIYKELASEFPDFSIPVHGDLSCWAKQGVLLLNATLTVTAKTPGSHQKRGWEQFTDTVIKELSKNRTGLILILWGNYAKQKESLIDQQKHFVIKSPHPSPFSAYTGFFGSKPFSKTNELLKQQGKTEIDWQIL